MTKTQIVEEEFEQLKISFRKIAFRDGNLYFCSLENGQTFDAFLGVDEKMRLWRFIGEYPPEKAGSRFEYREPQYPNTLFVLDINEDGELFCSAEQAVAPDSIGSDERILNFITTYLAVSAEARNVACWLIDA